MSMSIATGRFPRIGDVITDGPKLLGRVRPKDECPKKGGQLPRCPNVSFCFVIEGACHAFSEQILLSFVHRV
jgi:hypothetical protein